MKQRIDYMEWLNNHTEHSTPALMSQLLPEDVGEYMFIAGRTGIGKSVIALHLALCLATGKPFYGFPTREVSVNYLALEGGKTNWKDRMMKVAKQYPRAKAFYFQLGQPMDLLKPKCYQELKELSMGSQVLIWDNLRQVTSGQYLDPSYATDWIKAYQEFLREIKAVGVLTHHLKKKDSRYLIEPDDVYSLKGATEYVDASTTVLLLERRRQGHTSKGFAPIDNDALVLYFSKTRIADDELKPIYLRRNYDMCRLDREMVETQSGIGA